MLVLCSALVAGPVFAQKVYVDYDKNYDATGLKTFAWSETSDTSVKAEDPLLHSRIVNGIEYYLTLGGLREDEDDPDVYVTYHTSTEKQVSLDTAHFGYGYPIGWGTYGPHSYGWYGGVTTTTVRTVQKGTLVVDVWDAESDKLVWRGLADNITVTDSPAKMEKRIEKALKKMVDTWKKIKKQSAKGAS